MFGLPAYLVNRALNELREAGVLHVDTELCLLAEGVDPDRFAAAEMVRYFVDLQDAQVME